MKSHSVKCCVLLICTFLVFGFMGTFANAEVQHHEFVVQQVPVKRLCKTVYVMTVNGQFPGPNIDVREGDTVVIKVTNAGQYNVTLHWHGIRQRRTPWADGPEYVTQCPIRPGQTYTYRFTIEQQEGTLWWHAHSRWLRATIYGAFVIRPRLGASYPFIKPAREYPVLLGEWWNRDPMSVLRQATITGAAPNVSDAFTINGQPGDLYRCSSQDTMVFAVNAGETVLLRIINAALNQQLFFAIGSHMMTVVGADASYTKPFTTSYIVIGPGQTTDVLVTADQPPGRYYMAAHAYASAPGLPFDNTTTTAIFQYQSAGSGSGSGSGSVAGAGPAADCGSRKGNAASPMLPPLPAFNDTNSATAFTLRVKSPSKVNVPLEIDESLFFTIALGLINCSRPSFNCQGPNNTRFTASMNNVSFVFPRRNSLLQAYYQGNANGVFTTDFPAIPPLPFDYTGNVSRGLWQPAPGTKLFRLKYGSAVQLVLQGTSIFRIEEHPMHLHGYQFYVVGRGFGNFDPRRDPANFNLIDPALRNTIGTPPGGWVAIRFVADNPGIWLMHCHLDVHITWGLAMAFLVENGVGENQAIEPPPADLPQC